MIDRERAPNAVFVVVPAFNEAGSIGQVLSAFAGKPYSIVVVDDGSDDATPEVAAAFGVWVVRHPVNLGQGAALQTGTTAALRAGAGFVVHFDADGQHSADDIPRCLEPLLGGEADIVMGSRFLRREDRRRVPWVRRLVLRAGVVVNGLLTGLWLTDAHNGLRAMARSAAEKIRITENGYAHASEILAEARRHALRVAEVPATVVYSERTLAKGQSGWNSINIVVDLVAGRVLR